ncbi:MULTISPECIES: hypothetical protein [unclassified Oceanobacillus]|uniref:hypothetical protein n=1 Tax=unclassified Oceanobacillus TaxID=2630292 RepID=UPI001BEB15F4|nr:MULTISPECIES: hypothetical protein [unclassified Oceanobacillus]MBT2600906.1 hypothetical protein [Oceanobacillus sp. ISL-74]MBT2653433.1 hypothetical protein [Oceanobacillus sp. ISL-73]
MTTFLHGRFPKFGDIYQVVREDELFSAYMVVEIHEGEIVLGSGKKVFWNDLNDERNWKYAGNAFNK